MAVDGKSGLSQALNVADPKKQGEMVKKSSVELPANMDAEDLKKHGELLYKQARQSDVKEVGPVLGYTVRMSTLACLHDLNWLDDQIIGAYLSLVVKDFGNQVYYWDTFWTSFSKESVTKLVEHESKEILSRPWLLPINDQNRHWIVGYVVMKDHIPCCYVYDSLRKQSNLLIRAQVQTLVSQVYGKGPKVRFFDCSLELKENQAQSNSSDCGVFVCMYGKLLAQGKNPLHIKPQSKATIRAERDAIGLFLVQNALYHRLAKRG